jgi:hypothetical protein
MTILEAIKVYNNLFITCACEVSADLFVGFMEVTSYRVSVRSLSVFFGLVRYITADRFRIVNASNPSEGRRICMRFMVLTRGGSRIGTVELQHPAIAT